MFVAPFQFASDHVHIVGWGTIISFFIWLWRKATHITVVFSDGKRRFEVVENNINVISTNHLDHIERDMSSVAKEQTKSNEILESIDKGIAVLVDRGHQA